MQTEQTVLEEELQTDDLYVLPATQEEQALHAVFEVGVQAVMA